MGRSERLTVLAIVKETVGIKDGYSLGSMEVSQLGCDDGIAVGSMLGKADGTTVKVDDGLALGSMDGYSLGIMVLILVGFFEGQAVVG